MTGAARASLVRGTDNIETPDSQQPGLPMAITETRIGLVDLTCSGCDCGGCVTESLQEIARMHGVVHVRIDRRRTQIVVRHDHEEVSLRQISKVVETKGLGVNGQSSVDLGDCN